MSLLSLYLMGPPRIELDGELVKLDSHKATALLITLALNPQSYSRDALISLFWPDYDSSRGHTNLRHCLYLLRKALSSHWLLADRETLRINPAANIWLDIQQFHGYLEECLTHGHGAHEICPNCLSPLTAAVRLYRGDFLSGFGLEDSLEFDDWQLIQTESLRHEFGGLLERLVKYYSVHGAFEAAIEVARRWLALDRINEEVHCQLMQLYARSGKRSGALRQYQECVQMLQDELNIPPQAATTALYQSIIKGELTHATSRPVDNSFLMPGDMYESTGVARRVFVARENELAKLSRWVDLAVAGYGQAVFITGDAGRGKTALLQEFTQRAQERWSNLLVAGGNCNAYTGEGDPYLPFREVLGLLTGDIDALWTAGTIQREHARRLWDAFPLVVRALLSVGPDLLGTLVPSEALLRRTLAFTAGGSDQTALVNQLQAVAEQKAAGAHDPDLQQSALFEQYARVLKCLGRDHPLILVLDDLQWADAASINLLFYLGRHISGQRILIAGAYRPEEVTIGRRGDRHPLEIVVHDIQRTFGDIFIDLEQSEGRRFVEHYLATEPNRFSPGFCETLFQKTGGHPLFTVELLRGMEERGDLIKDGEGQWVEGQVLDWNRLPSRVEAVIAERISRLDAASLEALEIASIEGEIFTAEVVAQVGSTDEQEIIKRLSAELDRRHRLVKAQQIQHLGARRLCRYRFQHILYQNYLYASLDPARRVYLHEAVGTALEMLYATEAEEMAVHLARHFREAGMPDKAIKYLLAAGRKARLSSANPEAIACLNQALELIMLLPNSPERDKQELECRLTLGVPQVLTLGHASAAVENNYLRAKELSARVGDAYQRFQVLVGLRRSYHVRGSLLAALEVSEQILTQAYDLEQIFLARAHLLHAEILYRMGDFIKAQEHFEQSIAASGPQPWEPDAHLFGNDTLATIQVFQSVNLWQLGYPDQALRVCLEGLARARQLSHPFTLVCALTHCAELYDLRREPETAHEILDELMSICTEHDFVLFAAWGLVLRGCELAAQNHVEEGIDHIQRGLVAWKTAGARLSSPGFLANLAEANWKAGRYEEGLRCIQEALAQQEESEERCYEAELYRLQGELIQAQGGQDAEAEACFQRALNRARSQSARSWELRTALSLGRLWHKQGETSRARNLIAGIVHNFSEGFDLPDLQEAERFLKQVKRQFDGPNDGYQEDT